MFSSLSRWRPWHILLTWTAYWCTLALVTIGPAALPIWRVTRDGAKGNVSVNAGNDGVRITVIDGASTVWNGSAHLITIALWIAVPPLALWALWLVKRPRRGFLPAGDDATRAPLNAGEPDLRGSERSREEARQSMHGRDRP